MKQRHLLKLDNGAVVQLLDAPQDEPEDMEKPDWGGEEEDELEVVGKLDDVVYADPIADAPDKKERSPLPRRAKRSLTPIRPDKRERTPLPRRAKRSLTPIIRGRGYRSRSRNLRQYPDKRGRGRW